MWYMVGQPVSRQNNRDKITGLQNNRDIITARFLFIIQIFHIYLGYCDQLLLNYLIYDEYSREYFILDL